MLSSLSKEKKKKRQLFIVRSRKGTPSRGNSPGKPQSGLQRVLPLK